MEQFEISFWKDFCKIYSKMKEYYIKAEECSKDFSITLQPIKEQRDALDHIVRSYDEMITGQSFDSNNLTKNYITSNLSKAKGHIYRAFFDTADILTIILRQRISDYLCGFSFKEIKNVWSDYPEERQFLIDVNNQIAQARINKDIIQDEKQQEILFTTYDNIINKLFIIYNKVLKEVYPVLASL